MATVAKTPRSTTITLASDSAGPFDLTFRLFDDDGIQVYVNDIPRTDWTLSSNYVDGYDDNATVTFDASLSSGDVILVDSSLTPGRSDDYLDGPNLTYLQNIELGRIWAALADIKRDVNRSAKFFGAVSPLALEAGRMVVVNGAGDDLALGAIAAEIPAAEGHAQKAKQWAEEDEDVEVETGEYSAKHHSAKSAGWATTAAAEATIAAAEATTAAAEAAAAAASAASINPTQVVVVNGSDTVLLSHNNAVLFCTTTLTLSLTAAAALGNGFKLTVIADGGDVTIDPNGSETIDLAPSLLLRRGEIVSFVGDGTEFWSLSRLGNPDQLFDVTSPVASLAFDVPPGVKTARITYDNFEPVNNDDALGLQVGVNGSGGAFLTTSSYFNHYVNLVVATVNGSQITTTHFGISTQIDNALPTPHGYGYGEVVIQGLNQASEVVKIFGSRGGFNSSAQQIGGMFNGRITSTEDNFNAIRLIGSTGNINKLRGRIEWGY